MTIHQVFFSDVFFYVLSLMMLLVYFVDEKVVRVTFSKFNSFGIFRSNGGKRYLCF